MAKQKIEELFTTPTGLQPAYDMGSTTFYSSEKLKEKFILAFAKSSKGKNVVSQVEKLTKQDLIIPCYKSKNILSFLKHKLSKSHEKGIMAFYSVDDKKVIVIIDNSSTVFGSSSNNEIASTTIHECMHLVAGKNVSKFVQVFGNHLHEYYTEFFKDYFQIDNISKSTCQQYIKFMMNFEKRGASYANRQLANLYRLLQKLFKEDSKLDDKDFEMRLRNLIVAAKIFIVNYSSLMKSYKNFMMVFTSLNRAYLRAFREKNTYTFPIQEMISLSEVASVYSEMKPHDSVIKKLMRSV